MTQHHPEFSLTGALPTNTTVLEASAGTGKTYAIAALAVRYVAQGRARIDNLLLITFSRAATAELRLRVRERLHEAAFFLEDLIQGRTHATPTDAVLISLATGTPDQVAERAARLASAVADFDRATIMTTHEFCHSMLSGLGILAPQTPLSTLIEELGPLADEASADVYVSQFARREQGAPFPYGRRWNADPGAQEIGRRAASEDATLVGEDAYRGRG
ncbi:UvrD-helicase domain-containing protein [Propioniciclava flava]